MYHGKRGAADCFAEAARRKNGFGVNNMSKMPVLFVGHGSPMNAVEENRYTNTWKEIAAGMPRPACILCVSAHWYTRGTRIMAQDKPKTIHDMYGFPDELYQIFYPAPGSPATALAAKSLINRETALDDSWGIDHGAWSVLVHMYPGRDIPVFQLSVDALAPPETHYQIGRELAPLRKEGVLILGSGNVVHNLRMVDWHMEGQGFDWAHQFDDFIRQSILTGQHDSVVNYQAQGDTARLAVPTPDHFYPLLYPLGAAEEGETVRVFNSHCEMGSLSMTGYLWGN